MSDKEPTTDATEHPGEAAEEAGIVDQQAAAVEALDDDEEDDAVGPI